MPSGRYFYSLAARYTHEKQCFWLKNAAACMQRAIDGKANLGDKKSRHLGIQLNRKMCCRLCCVWMDVLEQGELPKKPYNNSKLCVLYKVLSRTPLSLCKKIGTQASRPWSCRDTGHPGRKSGHPAKIGTGGNPTAVSQFGDITVVPLNRVVRVAAVVKTLFQLLSCMPFLVFGQT